MLGGKSEERLAIAYWDGINSTVSPSIAKRNEISHAENVRSPQIGVLEKREGQVNKGSGVTSEGNHGLFYFNNDDATSNKVYRLVEEAGVVSIYKYSTSDTWVQLVDATGQGLTPSNFDSTIANEKLFLVNKEDANIYIDTDGTTIKSSAEAGDLYNSPNAKKALYYKNRLHLANYTSGGVDYPTTIIRSSYPLGVIGLVEGDFEAGVTSIDVTDTKYFYDSAGMNNYDIYRGGTFIETIVLYVGGVNETTLDINATTNPLLSSDEIWIAGTYTGEKQFRWINNPTSTGLDVKQYDTFKLSGGDESGITLFETIGNVMMIGNKRNLAAWDDYTLQNIDLNIGCTSSRGSVKMLGTLYFLDYGGIYGTTGGLPTLLSRKVERYIDGATKAGLESAAAGYKGLSVFFAIGNSTLYNEDGSTDKTLNDVVLEYSVADQNWYVHTDIPMSQFINFIDSDGKEQLWGTNSTTNEVSSFLESDTDNGSEIHMRVDTQELQLLKEFEILSTVIAIQTEIQRGSQVSAFISIDKKKFYQIEGQAKKGASSLKVHASDRKDTSPVNCRKIKVSYRDSSKQRCRINQMAIIFSPKTLEVISDE